MQQVISNNIHDAFLSNAYTERNTAKSGFIKKFMNWCAEQEENRFLWLGICFFGLIGMILPLTLLSILFFAGNNFTLWIIACAANVPVLALNLAAQPPKVTLPALFISLLIDAVIVGVCVGMLLLN